MTLIDAIAAAGMTPPHRIVEGRWMRFPGAGKKKSNRSGWCRLITPTIAVYGDWSTDFSAVWTDDSHRDDEASARALEQARRLTRELAAQDRRRQAKVAQEVARIVSAAQMGTHPYLARKGFPDALGLVHDGKLLIPVRDAGNYRSIISAQFIAEDGTKRFLPGGRTAGGIYSIGAPPRNARRILLCEGYATALSLHAALKRLPGAACVIVCFSANNLGRVAKLFPQAYVCADHDASQTGERVAKATGLPWAMPPEIGDFNDMHQRRGLIAVTEMLRGAFA